VLIEPLTVSWTGGEPGPQVHGGPGQGGMPRFNQGHPPAIGRPGWPAGERAAASAPEVAVRGGGGSEA
jgi:hypothetical protein